jgi:hypothetical protein
MPRSTITGDVTSTVTLGQNGYDPRLVITETGSVRPSLYGATGIIDPAGLPGGHITNHGAVFGGAGSGLGAGTAGGIGVELAHAGTLINTGTVYGGHGASGSSLYYYTAGGAGVDLQAGGSVMNTGVIRGGGAGYGNYNSTYGGAGIILSGGTLTSSGEVLGGNGGYRGTQYFGGSGGAAILATAGAAILNSGTVTGGGGQSAIDFGGLGGAGVQLSASSLTNTGTITGGMGGGANYFPSANGAAAVIMAVNSVLDNQGLIAGGAGGVGKYDTGDGGDGVDISGGTLINSGTITGGYGLGMGNAVDFGSTAGTLVIDPGAVFNGEVAANLNAVLVLDGSTSATLTSLGGEYLGFGMVEVAAGANWALRGTNILSAVESLQAAGTLRISGTLTDAGTMSVTGTLADPGTLSVSGTLVDTGAAALAGVMNTGTDGSILLAGLTLNGGHLNETQGGTLVVGNNTDGSAAGTLTIQAAATIIGDGTISADALSVAGALVALGGTLTLHASVSGSGTATIAAGATLLANGTLGVARVDFASGGDTLVLGKPADVTSTLSGFGTGDVVDLEKLIATTLTYAGGTLTLLDGAQVVDTVSLAGHYKAADFTLQSDGNKGTDILYAGPPATEFGAVGVQDLGLAGLLPDEGLIPYAHAGEAAVPAWLWGEAFAHKPG